MQHLGILGSSSAQDEHGVEPEPLQHDRCSLGGRLFRSATAIPSPWTKCSCSVRRGRGCSKLGPSDWKMAETERPARSASFDEAARSRCCPGAWRPTAPCSAVKCLHTGVFPCRCQFARTFDWERHEESQEGLRALEVNSRSTKGSSTLWLWRRQS